MLAIATGMGLLLAGREPATTIATDPALGNGLALAAGIGWALTLLGLRWLERTTNRSDGADPPAEKLGAASVTAGNLLACIAVLPVALPVTSSQPLDWALILYLGVFQIGLAYLLLTRGIGEITALEASLLLLLEPVLNPLWAWLVLGETPNAWAITGGAVIVAATATKTVWEARTRRRGVP